MHRQMFVAVMSVVFCGSFTHAQWGALKGRVVLDGDVPEVKPLVVKGDKRVRDSATCAAQDIPDESREIHPKTKGIANVFVWLADKPAQIHPDVQKSHHARIASRLLQLPQRLVAQRAVLISGLGDQRIGQVLSRGDPPQDVQALLSDPGISIIQRGDQLRDNLFPPVRQPIHRPLLKGRGFIRLGEGRYFPANLGDVNRPGRRLVPGSHPVREADNGGDE